MGEWLKVGALCAGYGGIELGLSSVIDCEPVWFSEFDKAPSKVLAHRWPGVPNLGDMTKIDWTSVEPIDILTGGTPCQDLSTAGKRAGMAPGTRSGLWSSMCEAISVLHPRLVVWENVRGALSAKSHLSETVVRTGPRGGKKVETTHRALGRVLGDLAELGYDARWYGLRAADVGAAHGRFRIFLFATPANSGGLGGLEAVERDGRGAQAVNGSGVPHESDRDPLRAGPIGVPGQLTLLPTPAVNDMGASYTPETWDAWTERMKAEHGNGNGHGKSLNIEALRLLPSAVQDWREYEAAIRRQEQAFGRPAPAPTEPGRNGKPQLSPKFCEWLMGLPEGHVTDVPDVSRNDQLKALGNGVVPQQCASALRAFLHDESM